MAERKTDRDREKERERRSHYDKKIRINRNKQFFNLSFVSNTELLSKIIFAIEAHLYRNILPPQLTPMRPLPQSSPVSIPPPQKKEPVTKKNVVIILNERGAERQKSKDKIV